MNTAGVVLQSQLVILYRLIKQIASVPKGTGKLSIEIAYRVVVVRCGLVG